MNRLAVNLSTVFTEVPFMERFKKARDCSFSYVECQFPYPYSVEEIQKRLEEYQLKMVLHNMPPGDWEQGDRGLAVNPDREDEFRHSVETTIRYATVLKTSKIHCMAGITLGIDHKQAYETFLERVHFAASQFAHHGLTLLIEPINKFDMPNYFLNDLNLALRILDTINLPNVKLQYDFYHIEKIHGNSLSLFKENVDVIEHVQIADAPGRHEPGTGKIHFPSIFKELRDSYKSDIGLEYTPLTTSEKSFEWLKYMKVGDRQ